jgi:hypothetical protein
VKIITYHNEKELVTMRWPFSKNRNVSNQPHPQPGGEQTERVASVLAQTVAEKRQEDPLIGAKVGAQEVLQRVMQGMKDEKGVHIESLLSALGALAGYACQSGLREEFIHGKGLSENQLFVLVGGADGRQYFFGDNVNKPLAETQYSVWSLAAGAVHHLGVDPTTVNLGDIFQHVSETVGGDRFGIPRIPDGHKPSDLPGNYVKHLWPVLLPVAKQFCPPMEWPVLFGLAAQDAILRGKDAIDPSLALSIVMESAIPMSKVDFNTL